MKSKLSDDVLRALAQAGRVPGWNNHSRDVRRFVLAGDFGHGCALFVVPFRRWAYRRQEMAAAAYWNERARA